MAQNIDFGDLAVKPFGEFRKLAQAVKKYPSAEDGKPVSPAEPAPHRRGRHGARYAMK